VPHPSMMLQTEPVPADLEPGLVSQDGVDASAQRVVASDPSAATRNPADWPARNGRSGACHEMPAGPHWVHDERIWGSGHWRPGAPRGGREAGSPGVPGRRRLPSGGDGLGPAPGALRSRPTLEHFDADVVEHWVTSAGRGRLAEITRATPTPHTEPFAWARSARSTGWSVQLVPRLRRDVTVAVVDPDTTIVVFDSPAPIVRSTGHSQSVDPLTGEVGAFFARMKVPIDFQDGASSGSRRWRPGRSMGDAGSDPATLCSAGGPARRAPRGFRWAGREAHRMREEHRPDWDAGEALTTDLGLDRD